MCRPLIFCGAVCVALTFASHPIAAAGLPEPPLVVYGQLRDNAANARITTGTLTWTWSPSGSGNPVVISTVLTNVDDQFSFVIFVPCESEISGVAVSTNTLRLVNPSIAYTRTSVLWNGQPVTLRDSAQGTVTISPATRGRIERLDLGLGIFAADSDEDGLPDWWESQYPSAANPNVDTDSDGLTNFREYIAGTNPEDADSSFEFVTVVEEIPGVMLIQWSSVPGKSYTLLRAPTLSLNPLDYQPVRTGISAQGNLTTYRDTTGVGHQFYRVRIAE